MVPLSRAYRTVALQAVGVAVIAAVIFLAFLRPSEPGDLSGLDAGGEPPAAVNTDPELDEKDKAKDRKGSKGANGRSGNGSSGDRNGRDRPGSGPGASGVGSGGSQSSDNANSPADNQYGDVVARLLARVANADPNAFIPVYFQVEPAE